MRVLLTGATGYTAKKLLPVLPGSGHEMICKEYDLKELLSIEPISYKEAVREAFEKIEMSHVFEECDSAVQKNMGTYKDPTLQLKIGLIEEIVGFIKSIE